MSDHSVQWKNVDEQELHDSSGDGYNDLHKRGPLTSRSMPSFPFRVGSNQRNNYACVNLIAHSELPLESDRKAVLGCFAVVLASVKAHAQYEFESRGGGLSSQNKGSMNSSRHSTINLSAGVDDNIDDIPNDYSVATSSSSSSLKEEQKETCSSDDSIASEENVEVSGSSSHDDKHDKLDDTTNVASWDDDNDRKISSNDTSDDNQSNNKDESRSDGSSIGENSNNEDNVNGNNNEAEMASISTSRGALVATTPVMRTNLVSSFFQRESKNDMIRALRGKNRQSRAHQRYIKRIEELHQELLKCTSNLLLLDESEAIALTPILFANNEEMDLSIVMEPFLQQLSSRDAAFNILVMVLFNFLLHSSEENEKIRMRQSKNKDATIVGYDSRVRHVFKRLAVVILSVKDKTEEEEQDIDDNEKFVAVDLKERVREGEDNNAIDSNVNEGLVRKFENLEHAIASRLLLLSKLKKEEMEKAKNAGHCRSNSQGGAAGTGGGQLITWERPQVVLKDKLIRTASIVGAGLAAGAIFAVSGGLAAPGIAATVGMVAGSTVAATTAVVALTGTIAMSTIFGVSGAGLVAAKVGSRTRGLKEFVFKRDMQTRNQVELSRTVCVSGWIKSNSDFHRPWGITPEGLNRTEQLQRFFSIFDPEKVDKCDFILQQWKGREDQFWDLLRDTHGRDPDHLLPLYGPMDKAALNEEEHSAIDCLLETLGYPQLSRRADQMGRLSFDCEGDSDNDNNGDDDPASAIQQSPSFDCGSGSPIECRNNRRPVSIIERGRPWDFHATFGGELYTIQWEPELLLTLNDSMGIVGQEIAQTATLKVLQETALSSLASALSLPSNLMRFTRLIDGPWALCVKRADDAGIQLARSLLESTAGHRPVTLIGYGMGARMIYSCLKELAYHQEKWEDKREGKKDPQRKTKGINNMSRKSSRRKVNVSSWNFRVRRRLRDKNVECEATKPILDTNDQEKFEPEDLKPSAHEQEDGGNCTDSDENSKSERGSDNREVEIEEAEVLCEEENRIMSTQAESQSSCVSPIPEIPNVDGDGWQLSEVKCNSKDEDSGIDDAVKTNDNPTDGIPSHIAHSTSIDNDEEKEDEEEETTVKYMREPASIVEDAILMGCPAYIHRPSWEACRRMVGGRLVNCYNPSDLILALMFQYECMSGLFRPTCGTYAVKVPGVENYNVSGLISAHSEYSVAVGEILQLIQHGEPVAASISTSDVSRDISRVNSVTMEDEEDSSDSENDNDDEDETDDEEIETDDFPTSVEGAAS